MDHLLKIKKNQKFKETADTKYIYRKKLNKACFQHDKAYGDLKDLAKRAASDKVLIDKAFSTAKMQNVMDIREVLLLWLIHFFIKNS